MSTTTSPPRLPSVQQAAHDFTAVVSSPISAVQDAADDRTEAVSSGDGGPATRKVGFGAADVIRRTELAAWERRARPRFILKQEWVGRVDAVGEDTFHVTLATRAEPEQVEEAELDLEDVTPEDRANVRPGATFYWVVGYRDELHGQRLGVSTIIFRRMVAPTEEQLHAADTAARRFVARLGADSAEGTQE